MGKLLIKVNLIETNIKEFTDEDFPKKTISLKKRLKKEKD